MFSNQEEKYRKDRIITYLEENWEINYQPDILKMLYDFDLHESEAVISFLHDLVDLHEICFLDYYVNENSLRLSLFDISESFTPDSDLMWDALMYPLEQQGIV